MFLNQSHIRTGLIFSELGCFRAPTRVATKMRSLFLISLLSLLLSLSTQVQIAQTMQQLGLKQPTFVKDMNSLTIKENTPIGEVVYTLEAQLEPPIDTHLARITYGIEGTKLFSVDKKTGQVRVAQTIDREQTSDSVIFTVSATAIYGLPNSQFASPATQLTITVFILDENDTPPKIKRVKVGRNEFDYFGPTQQPLFIFGASQQMFGGSNKNPIVRLNVSESLPVDSVIVDLIEVIDVDKASLEPMTTVCIECGQEFDLRSTSDSTLNDKLNISIVLISQLVHIPRNNLRQLQVVFSDGKFNSTITFEVTIEDIQNRPPQFIGSTTCIVHENVPIDYTIMTIQAVDGDVISLDDAASVLPKNGYQNSGARQILYNLMPQSSPQLESINKNFKLHPLTGQLQVANKLDREAYLEFGALSLKVEARELTINPAAITIQDDSHDSMLRKLSDYIDPSPDARSEIDITVILVDVNDNDPHWLNSTEIEALNMNQMSNWHASLPNDRDTGRNYQLQIKENSLAGTPITTHNDMFVYDLDNGENAKFNISLLDPFDLFDVEPKQVSGFALITLKLMPNNNRLQGQQVRRLDYENPNERSFIVQLLATETSTAEKRSSKAQVQINVIDVNDNAPEFKELAYHANIREDAAPGKTVLRVQASDRDELPSQRLSYSLHGHSSYLFDIDRDTGLITVAKCEQVTTITATRSRHSQVKKQCIDYEFQKSHHIMVEVSDGELSSKVPLTVFIDDASDNPPVFTLPILDVVIEEGADRLDPPIRIEAVDADQSSVLSYSIVEGNFEGLFSINNITGELQITRPIRIPHEDLSVSGGDYRQQQLNKMTLVVQATDGTFTSNGTVRIDVLDANDNAPKFIRTHYSVEIPEITPAGQIVANVTAIDSDRGNNARVSYRLQRGSYGQFEIDESTGAIFVSHGAQFFDADKRENYTLEVVAYDHGLISKSSSVLVYVHILDTIKKPPEFYPQIQRAIISENLLNNSIIHRMKVANEEQLNIAQLIFEPGPIEALDKNGQPVASSEIGRLESLIGVSQKTGDVMVSSGLDHDFASYINLTVYVSLSQSIQLSNGDAPLEDYIPRSVGYLIINVVDENSNAPMFAAPWTSQEPELSFQMLEELPVGSILTQLIASDIDSKISHFKIDPPNEYFELSSAQQGVIVNKKLIDYDALMRQTWSTPSSHHRAGALSNNMSAPLMIGSNVGNNFITFNVYVFDSGIPQLSAKATISVEILPVNDWDCKFDQSVYEVRVKENTAQDTAVIQVHANDFDYGEHHNTLRYQLIGAYSEFFNIDQKTGVITVSNKGSLDLDREKLSQSKLTVTVVARDDPPMANFAFQYPSHKQSRSQQQQNFRSCSATIKVNVDDVNDNPPLFSQRLYEATAYDTDIVDVPLIRLIVRDDDSVSSNSSSTKSTGNINSFKIISGNINESFNISSTGVIYVTKPIEETSNRRPIQLRVQVKQQSASTGPMTSFTDECLVQVNLFKINRYGPEWRFDQPSISVEENSKPGTLVTQLKCIDKDNSPPSRVSGFEEADLNAKKPVNSGVSQIRYYIKNDGSNVLETPEFKLDSVTGKLVTRVELDRESKSLYQLIVACEDNGKPQSLESVTTIYIDVLDVDDNKPEFLAFKASQETLSSRQLGKPDSNQRLLARFSIEEHQSKGLPVGELKALDRDLQTPFPISYCLIEGNEFMEFSLDRVTGILYTNQTLDREKQSTYDLLVKAINDGTTCEDHVIPNAPQNSSSTSRVKRATDLADQSNRKTLIDGSSYLTVKVDVLDINDNAPTFKKQVYRAGVHHRSLMNTLVTQVPAFDPDSGLNGTLSYKISEILMYKTVPNQSQAPSRAKYDVTNEQPILSKPIKLIQFPFKIDQQGNLYTQQLLTQYQLMSMFVLSIEASEQAEPWRAAKTKLEIYIYETNSQLKIRINLHPRLVELYRSDIELLLSNATKYTAIINRARSYHDSFLVKNQNYKPQPPDSVNPQVPSINVNSGDVEPNHSNIHLIFVDNFRIVNPNLVMEKFDLTSAQLFMPQTLSQTTDANNGNGDNKQSAENKQLTARSSQQQIQLNEVSSLIDKIALASAVQSAEFHSSPSSLAGVDWLESPSMLYVTLSIVLLVIGFVGFLFGCCCTSRIKDHIVKVAMNKLVKQQNLQAKINEQVLAATNGRSAALNGSTGQDFILQQGGFLSSFDATKGCISNNADNMNIIQRALDSGEFIDPNYTTLDGHINMGAHYYEDTELEHQSNVQANGCDRELEVGTSKQFMNGSPISLSPDDIEDDDKDLNNGGHQQQLMKKSKLVNNATSNITQNHRQRQRQPDN